MPSSIIAKRRDFRRFQNTLGFHEILLRDPVRNRAFAAALRRAVRPGSRVLDIGSGTGVWAVLAAKLGAREVYAVEEQRMLVPLIRRLAAENGVADRVHAVFGNSRRVRLPGRFDVLLSETIGSRGYDENIVPTMIDARRRFLRPEAAILPSALSLWAAPYRNSAGTREVSACLPLKSESIRRILGEIPSWASEHRAVRTVAPAVCLIRTDLTAVRRRPDLSDLRARWTLRRPTPVDGFLMWVQVEVAPGIRISTRAGTHWDPTRFPVLPGRRAAGTLEVLIALARGTTCWTATHRDRRGRERTESHGPIFGYLRLTRAGGTEPS